MPPEQPETPAPADASSIGGPLNRVSHGYAPDGRPVTPPPVPLEKIVGDVVDNVQATVKAELELLEARGELALHGVTWTATWGAVAATALGVALLALAVGAILALSPLVGPLLATLIVVAVLVAIAGFAGWRAQRSYADISTAFRRDLAGERGDD